MTQLGNIFNYIPEVKILTDCALAWCESKNYIPYFETSAKDGRNVNEAFDILVKNALELRKQPLTYRFPNDSLVLNNKISNKAKCSCQKSN